MSHDEIDMGGRLPTYADAQRARAAWQQQKPSQADIDTTARVLRWLSDHAHYFPSEWPAEASDFLIEARNMCSCDVEYLVTTQEELEAQHAHNRAVSDTENQQNQ